MLVKLRTGSVVDLPQGQAIKLMKADRATPFRYEPSERAVKRPPETAGEFPPARRAMEQEK